MKKIKKLWIVLAVLVCLAVPVQADAIIAGPGSDTTVDYYVKVSAPDGGANFRYGAGVEYEKLISNMMPNGTVLYIVGERTANNGKKWGYTEYQGMWGYVALSQTVSYNKAEEEARQKEAEEQAALQKEAEEQAALQKEAEEQAALQKEAEEQAALQKEAEEQAALQKEAEEQAALQKEAEEQAALQKEAKEKEEAEKRAAEEKKEKEEPEQDEKEDERVGMDTGFLVKLMVIISICLIAAVTAGMLILHYKKHKSTEMQQNIPETKNTLREDEVFCRYCGKKNSNTSEYCKYCGKKIK